MNNRQSWENRQAADQARRPLETPKTVMLLKYPGRELMEQYYDLVEGGMAGRAAADSLGITYEVVTI